MRRPFVAILVGSDADLPIIQITADTLDALGISYEMKVISAHRTPDTTHTYVKDADARGCAVFIAAAGMAAHLGGVVASLTLKPVIGIPLDSGSLKGMDSLLSTVQMPGGIPVACVAIGEIGAKNAAYLAAQIMALSNPELAELIRQEREANADQVRAKDADLQRKLLN